jgi:hypothetical protein
MKLAIRAASVTSFVVAVLIAAATAEAFGPACNRPFAGRTIRRRVIGKQKRGGIRRQGDA